MKDEPIPPWLTHKLGQILCLPSFFPSTNVIRQTDQGMIWPQPNTLPLDFNPPEYVYQPDLQIDYGDPGRSYPQVDSPPVFPPQSSNYSDNGHNVPYLSQDEYPDTQAFSREHNQLQ